MKGLIDDLLFLARSDASKAAPVFSVFDLSDAVWSAALPFEAVAFEQGVQLCTQIDPGLQYLGHEGQIRQLAAILIDNACKYAGRGGTVLVRLYREGETATLMVQNSGAPIPKQALPRLFERFYRADSSRARASGGYGPVSYTHLDRRNRTVAGICGGAVRRRFGCVCQGTEYRSRYRRHGDAGKYGAGAGAEFTSVSMRCV